MFSFQTLELLIIVAAGLLLFGGLVLLALRRRNEILQDFLTPHEQDIEQEFFKKRPVREAPPKEEKVEEIEPSEDDPMQNASWGTPGEES